MLSRNPGRLPSGRRAAIGWGVVATAVLVVLVALAVRPRSGDGPAGDALQNALGTAIPTVSLKVHVSKHLVVSSVAIGTAVHVAMVVSGSSGTPTGGVGIDRYAGPTCSGTPTGGAKATLTDGKVDGVVSTATAAVGSISFKARYGGSATYAVRDTPCVALSITKAKPTVGTTIHNLPHAAVTSVTLGTWVHALVELSGPVGTPTGVAGVNLYANSTCSGAFKSSGPLPITNGKHDFALLSQLATGSAYSFKATYLGDANYLMTTGPCKSVSVVLP